MNLAAKLVFFALGLLVGGILLREVLSCFS
jgi:hypothetical protein